jgi:hypothetical protein
MKEAVTRATSHVMAAVRSVFRRTAMASEEPREKSADLGRLGLTAEVPGRWAGRYASQHRYQCRSVSGLRC